MKVATKVLDVATSFPTIVAVVDAAWTVKATFGKVNPASLSLFFSWDVSSLRSDSVHRDVPLSVSLVSFCFRQQGFATLALQHDTRFDTPSPSMASMVVSIVVIVVAPSVAHSDGLWCSSTPFDVCMPTRTASDIATDVALDSKSVPCFSLLVWYSACGSVNHLAWVP